MPKRQSHAVGSELFIVDNSEEEWRALRYLHDWCELSKALDIATGYFEIGALLGLEGEWQKVGKIRILMGDEVSKRTKRAFDKGLGDISSRLDKSIEAEKTKNHFLNGVSAIVDAIKSDQIECRVYRKDKFHAKAYITHARKDVIGSSALVGSSNFTHPGLTENIELNVQITGAPVAVLQEWYEEHWEEAEDVTPDILQVVARHTHEYLPFDIYARALQQYFLGHEETASEWEENSSKIYPVLARYQRDGYLGLLKRANIHGGAFLCDGVGLGKTFVGLMLIERFICHENKNVVLFVPKAAKEPVWERELQKRLPELFKGYSRLKVFSHTDLLREKCREELEQVRQQAHVVIIDEAHHFRNTGTKGEGEGERRSRYWRLYDILEGKQVFHLTATPINNSLIDFQHMVELFSRHQADYFSAAPLGIHSLAGHIRQLESSIERQVLGIDEGAVAGEVNFAEANDLLSADALFDALVVQRSRSYVKESMSREGDGEVLFPEPRAPKVAHYSVKQTYGKLLDMVAEAFNKRDPLFSLPIYYPYAFYKGDDASIDLAFEKGRRKQVVALIRTNFLKRFESSAEAFRKSCWNLLWKLLAWLDVHAETETEKQLVDHWKRRNKRLIGYEPELDLLEEGEDDLIPEEMLDAVEKLNRDEFEIEKIIQETIQDLEQLADFLEELEKFKPSQDKKLRELIKLLNGDPVLSVNKVIIFSEFSDTARYLAQELQAEGIKGVAQIDSGYAGELSFIAEALAHEAKAANLAKSEGKPTVIIGNPPYSNLSANLSKDAVSLVERARYFNKLPIKERNQLQFERNINDDYIKFLSFSSHYIEKNNIGCMGFITNSVYLRSDSLRGLREWLNNLYSRRYVLDLHGAATRGTTLVSEDDANVFEIEQSVAIFVGIRCSDGNEPWHYSSVDGSVSRKTDYLINNSASKAGAALLELDENGRLIPADRLELSKEFNKFCLLSNIMTNYSEGVKTGRDWLVVGFDEGEPIQKLSDIANSNESDATLTERIGLNVKKAWNFQRARKTLSSIELTDFVEYIDYRPFDRRPIFFHPQWVASAAAPIMQHVRAPIKNVSLLVGKKSRSGVANIYWCSDIISDKGYCSSVDNVSVFPLFISEEIIGKVNYRPSISYDISIQLENITGLEYIDGLQPGTRTEQSCIDIGAGWDGSGDLLSTFGPRNVFSWIYAILFSPQFRSRYAEFLSTDFPRVPLPKSREVFVELSALGSQMTSVHLLKMDERPDLESPSVIFAGQGNARVVAGYPKYENGKVLINPNQWFEDVVPQTWEFEVGNYRVCEKWLKDRAGKGGKKPTEGRVLSNEDILHYRRIVTAIDETRRIMKEIDQVIDRHGGLPDAFYVPPPPPPSVEEIIQADESRELEFKSTYQWDVREGKQNTALRKEVLKTLAAFMNSDGGTLVIGVTDDKEIIGLGPDLKLYQNGLDGFEQAVFATLGTSVGNAFSHLCNLRFADAPDDKAVCVIEVSPSKEPVFLKFEGKTEFFVRRGNGSRSLDATEQHSYIKQRFT